MKGRGRKRRTRFIPFQLTRSFGSSMYLYFSRAFFTGRNKSSFRKDLIRKTEERLRESKSRSEVMVDSSFTDTQGNSGATKIPAIGICGFSSIPDCLRGLDIIYHSHWCLFPSIWFHISHLKSPRKRI